MKKQSSVTIKDVMSWRPCANYTEDRIHRLFGKRKRLTGDQILNLKIFAEDRLWAILHEPFLSECDQRLLAADIAEHVLKYYETDYPYDKRLREIIQIARDYAKCKINDSVRNDACNTAWTVVKNTTNATAWYAARAAAWSIYEKNAREAACSASCDAIGAVITDASSLSALTLELDWQITRARYYLHGTILLKNHKK